MVLEGFPTHAHLVIWWLHNELDSVQSEKEVQPVGRWLCGLNCHFTATGVWVSIICFSGAPLSYHSSMNSSLVTLETLNCL